VRKRRDWPTRELLSALRAHEEAKRLRDARLVKASRNSWVTTVETDDVRYSPRVVVKEPRFVLPIRVRRAWLVAQAFTVRGLPVPEHLALVEERAWGVPRKAWLIARDVANAQDLDRYIESHPSLPPEFFRDLAHTVSRIFDHGIYHGDLSGKNLLIKEQGRGQWQFYFLDLESVILWRKPTSRRRSKNIDQLYRTVRRLCDASQRDCFWSELSRLAHGSALPPR
jgi:hypothetical protein